MKRLRAVSFLKKSLITRNLTDTSLLSGAMLVVETQIESLPDVSQDHIHNHSDFIQEVIITGDGSVAIRKIRM